MNRRSDQKLRKVPDSTNEPIEAVAFDFGGVLAEEGFREGLQAIARLNWLDPQQFFELATSIVYSTGYVVGKDDERSFWQALRRETGIKGSDMEFRGEILKRFLLRPWMIDIVRRLRSRGYVTAILSDQTQWLDELDAQYHFFKEFHRVFNSYHSGKGKKDPSLFLDVAQELGIPPSKILFIDDSPDNVERARSQGLRAIHYKDRESFEDEMKKFGLP